MSFLSVIMPVYNAEKFIRQTVSSVLGQSFSDLELICIDDCSTDGSFSVLKDIERTEPRLHVFRTEKNSGAGSARNLGLEKASSAYITFVDADDMTEKELYDKAFAGIYGTQECPDEVVWGLREHQRKGRQEKARVITPEKDETYRLNESSEIVFELEEKTLFGYVWNSAYRRDIIEKHHIRFRDTYYYEDFWFNLDFIQHAETLRTVAYPGYLYRRVNSKSITSKNSDDYYDLSYQRIYDLSVYADRTGCSSDKVCSVLGSRMVRYYISAIARQLKYERYSLADLKEWMNETLKDDWLNKTIRESELSGSIYRYAGSLMMRKKMLALYMIGVLCKRMV